MVFYGRAAMKEYIELYQKMREDHQKNGDPTTTRKTCRNMKS